VADRRRLVKARIDSRRADAAEWDLIKSRLLTYLSDRLGLELEAVITGVAD
jgi:hypothetical protein